MLLLLIAPAQREGLFYLLTSERCDDQRCLHPHRTRDDVNRTWDAPLRLFQLNLSAHQRLARTPQGTAMAMVFTTPNAYHNSKESTQAQELDAMMIRACSCNGHRLPQATRYGLSPRRARTSTRCSRTALRRRTEVPLWSWRMLPCARRTGEERRFPLGSSSSNRLVK